MTSSTPPPDRPAEPSAEGPAPQPADPAAPASPSPPSPPSYTPPPAQPPYTPPQPGGPVGGYAGPPSGAYAAPAGMPRPGMVTGASITMIVLGALGVIFGLLFLIAGAFVSGAANTYDIGFLGTGLASAMGGVLIVLGLIFIAISILEIVAGAQVLSGRGWARITGIVLSAIWALLAFLALFRGSMGGSRVIDILVLAANAFIIWALATTGPWFATRSRSSSALA